VGISAFLIHSLVFVLGGGSVVLSLLHPLTPKNRIGKPIEIKKTNRPKFDCDCIVVLFFLGLFTFLVNFNEIKDYPFGGSIVSVYRKGYSTKSHASCTRQCPDPSYRATYCRNVIIYKIFRICQGGTVQ
jgi:hypothetical protein